MKSNMRQAAGECVARARKLIAQNDEALARHACLELRFAIEYITYSQLEAYRKELPDEALKKWTPKQLIAEMQEVDRYADKSSHIRVGKEHAYAVPPPREEMQSVGEDRRFSLKWANKNHNALGNFLHVPTVHQIESGAVPTLEKIIGKANDVADACENILSSPLFNTNFGNFLNFDCIGCNTAIKRREGSFTPEGGIVCPKCKAIHDVKPAEGSLVDVSLRQMSYKCPEPCGTENWIGIHHIEVGKVCTCVECGRRARIDFALSFIEPEK